MNKQKYTHQEQLEALNAYRDAGKRLCEFLGIDEADAAEIVASADLLEGVIRVEMEREVEKE